MSIPQPRSAVNLPPRFLAAAKMEVQTMPAPLRSPSREDIDFFIKIAISSTSTFFTSAEIHPLRAAIDAAIAAKRERIRRAAKGGRHSAEYERIFNQRLNLWTDYAALKLFTFNVRLAATTRALSQCRHVRLYHDHALVKPAGQISRATNWHQDAPC